MDEIKKLGFVNVNDEDITIDGDYTDNEGNLKNAFIEVEIADTYFQKRQEGFVQFRWHKSEIERAKKVANKKGLKYQSYIKSVLKQALDKDEKELFSN